VEPKESMLVPRYPLLSRLLAPRGNASPEALRRAVEGKTVLVTGASFGIGEALAERLGQAGARVLLAARSEGQLHSLAQRITDAGGVAQCYPLDLRDPEQVDAVAARILAQQGHVDVVVHNAGKSIRRSLYRSLDRAHDFERTMAVNYLGPVRLQLALLPSMIARRGGQIINVSAVSVRLPAAAFWAAYSASKSAFDIWVASAAPELRHCQIACTSIYFGLVHTAMSAPTAAYASMPGQTADQAACVICRAIIERPRSIAPWWLEPLRWLSPPAERMFEWLQYRLGPVDPACREIQDR
jgi:NAD(P)-dependent dehydrogenase (short-subunit alcohol dehydrogenase family)